MLWVIKHRLILKATEVEEVKPRPPVLTTWITGRTDILEMDLVSVVWFSRHFCVILERRLHGKGAWCRSTSTQILISNTRIKAGHAVVPLPSHWNVRVTDSPPMLSGPPMKPKQRSPGSMRDSQNLRGEVIEEGT